jgi:hypothetical protein
LFLFEQRPVVRSVLVDSFWFPLQGLIRLPNPRLNSGAERRALTQRPFSKIAKNRFIQLRTTIADG